MMNVPALTNREADWLRPRLMVVAMKKTGRIDEAEDLVADAMLRMIEKMHLFRCPYSDRRSILLRWGARIVSNLSVDNWRKAKTRQTVYAEELSPEVGIHFFDTIEGGNVEREAMGNMAEKRILRIIDGVPNRVYRDVLRAQFTGLSYNQIARDNGIAIGTVRSRLHRARALLKQQMDLPEESN